MTLPFTMSASMHTTCYNGVIGPCERCHNVKPLPDGHYCIACRQAIERQTPRPAPNKVRVPDIIHRFCPDCMNVELTGHQQRCARCAKERRDEQRRQEKARWRARQREKGR